MKLIWTLLLLASCSSFNQKSKQLIDIPLKEESLFSYTDLSGSYSLRREIGLNKAQKYYYYKGLIANDENSFDKFLEKNVIISDIGRIKSSQGFHNVMRPKLSQHTVYLDGKKYFSQIKIDKKNRSLDVYIVRPKGLSSGLKKIKFPETKGVFCFYNQLTECLKFSGILKQVNNSKSKKNFYIIWDNYPFFEGNQSLGQPEVFSKAKVWEKESEDKNSLNFVVEVGSTLLDIYLDKEGNLEKKLWAAEGITLSKQE